MLKRLLWCYVNSLSFWRGWKLLEHLSTRENERNLCQILLTIEHSDWDTQKLLQTRQRNKKKKILRFWLWLSIVWKTLELTGWYQSKEFSFITFLYSLQISPFPLVQSIRLHIRAMDLIPSLISFLIPCRGCEKSAKEPSHSHHFVRQRDNIHARTTDMCVDPRGYMTPGWRNLF